MKFRSTYFFDEVYRAAVIKSPLFISTFLPPTIFGLRHSPGSIARRFERATQCQLCRAIKHVVHVIRRVVNFTIGGRSSLLVLYGDAQLHSTPPISSSTCLGCNFWLIGQ